jgi:3-oxoacyl-[acyl-carrier-protein] synthase II
MRGALDACGRTSSDVTAVWANRNGHRVSDAGEAGALSRLFVRPPHVHDAKRLFGDPIGAGGTLSAGLALLAFRHRAVADGAVVLVNSSSMGGAHVSIALQAPPLP